MKKILLLAFLNIPAKAQTLTEVKELTLKNSSQLRVLSAEVREGEAKREESSYLRRPTLGLAGGGEFEGTRREKELSPLAYAYMNYVLYDGGQATLQQKLSQKELERREQELPFHKAEVENAVETLFLEFAYAEARLKALDEGLKLIEQLRGRASRRRDAGLIGESDVLEFDLRQNDFLMQKAEVEGGKKAALKALSLLAGQEVSPRDYSLPNFDADSSSPEEGPRVRAPGVLRLEKEKEILELETARLSAMWNPKLEFEARAGRLPRESFEDIHEPRIEALLLAKWDFLSQAQKNAAKLTLAARSNILSARVLDSERVQMQQLLELKSQLESLKNQYAIHQRRFEPAKKYYRATLDEFERGVKNAPDVAHAAETFWETQMKDLELRYESVLKELAWKRLTLRKDEDRLGFPSKS